MGEPQLGAFLKRLRPAGYGASWSPGRQSCCTWWWRSCVNVLASPPSRCCRAGRWWSARLPGSASTASSEVTTSWLGQPAVPKVGSAAHGAPEIPDFVRSYRRSGSCPDVSRHWCPGSLMMASMTSSPRWSPPGSTVGLAAVPGRFPGTSACSRRRRRPKRPATEGASAVAPIGSSRWPAGADRVASSKRSQAHSMAVGKE